MDLMQIAGAVAMVLFAVIVCLLAGALLVWLKTTSGNAKYDYVRKVALDIVTQVEQLWRSGKLDADERYQKAKAMLQSYFPNLTDDQIKMFIEAAVLYMKLAMGAHTVEPPAMLPTSDTPIAAAMPRKR